MLIQERPGRTFVIASFHYSKALPQLQWLKTMQLDSVAVLEARSLTCPLSFDVAPGPCSVWSLQGRTFPLPFQLLEPHSLHSFTCGLFLHPPRQQCSVLVLSGLCFVTSISSARNLLRFLSYKYICDYI